MTINKFLEDSINLMQEIPLVFQTTQARYLIKVTGFVSFSRLDE